MKLYVKKIKLLFWNIRFGTVDFNRKATVEIIPHNSLPKGIKKIYTFPTADISNIIKIFFSDIKKTMTDRLNINNNNVIAKVLKTVSEGSYFIRYDDEEYGYFISERGLLRKHTCFSEVKDEIAFEVVVRT